MLLSPHILYLPTSLLLVLLSNPSPGHLVEDTRNQLQWPYNLPPHVKYWPEDPPHRRRDLEAIQEHLDAQHKPVAVRKMSEDEGEMFFPEYWGFGEEQLEMTSSSNGWVGIEPARHLRNLREDFQEDDRLLLANSSAEISLRPAFGIHESDVGDEEQSFHDLQIRAVGQRNAADALKMLHMRGFQCPSNTYACTGISQPNYCCANGESCYNITDTGLGPVACCPNGATCGGIIKACAPADIQCPQTMGGACCISGFACFGVGCISNVVVTVYSTLTQFITPSSTTVISTTSITTTITQAITPSSTTIIITTSITATSDTNTALQTTSACSPCYKPCPVNMGGGCCPSDRVCVPGLSCPLSPGSSSSSLTCSATGSAAVKGTTISVASAVSTTSASAVTGGVCPTGFYACSAYYPGAGCCRIGRDCSTTDCPITASITLVSSGFTIVVPLVPSATTLATASCAVGWAICDASVGGNCCPTGFVCGPESCTTSGATATATVSKQPAALGSSGTRASVGAGVVVVIGALSFAVMIW